MAKKKVIAPLKTRHSEEKMYATEQKDMLKKYITESAYREYNETFIDEDTGEVVDVPRRELLFERGSFISPDLLAKIQFSILACELEGLHVSNQQRSAYDLDSNRMNVWIAKVEINAKGRKFIFYANNISNAIEIVRDYVEQKFEGCFNLLECKEFVRSIILEDTFKEMEEQDAGCKKFFQIDTIVVFDDCETEQTFIVHTTSIEKAMIVIDHYITEREKECKANNEEKGLKYTPREFKVGIEKAAPIPIGTFIPMVFSDSYCINE